MKWRVAVNDRELGSKGAVGGERKRGERACARAT